MLESFLYGGPGVPGSLACLLYKDLGALECGVVHGLSGSQVDPGGRCQEVTDSMAGPVIVFLFLFGLTGGR